MPVLVLHLPGSPPRGFVLTDRALIGRRPFNTLIVPDATVSRIHAWIGQRDDRFVLFDSGSRTGTAINGQRVTDPTPLKQWDEIRIGFATITYMEGDQLPADVAPLEPPPARPAADPYDGGIYFDCACGGPMWVTAEHAGAVGKCRYCGAKLVVPHRSGQTARKEIPNGAPPQSPPPVAPPIASSVKQPPRIAPQPSPVQTQADICSICQSEISPTDDRTSCPSCQLMFHSQCWKENYGCSAYGCDQVNALAPRGALAEAAEAYESAGPAQDSALATADSSFPWDSVLLALSFVAMATGAIAYGVPSAVVLLVCVIVLLIGRARRKGFVLASILVSLIGIVAGYAMSMFWWKNTRIWERFTQS